MSVIYILFSKARAEVIRLLFTDPARELHVRDLTRHSGLALRTLQTELKKLEQADLLISRRDGNRLYFRANANHPVFQELQGLALKTVGLSEQIKSALDSLEGIELAFVFGSIAEGGENAHSDVDLFIIGKIGLRQLVPRLRPLSEEIGREFNPYVISRDKFAKKVKSGDSFILNVLDSPKLWIQGEADEFGAMAS